MNKMQPSQKNVSLRVNGKEHKVEVNPRRALLSVLRDNLELTGAKYGCGEGQCGACTVLIDGEAVRSCVRRVGDLEGNEITTIEGLDENGRLHPLQQSFLENDALQCGYCTPGMIMSGVALLKKNPRPQVHEIVEFMQGNICRCGTYLRIVRAIQQASDPDFNRT